MTTSQTHKGFGTIASALTTELNALANNANSAASSAIDNSTNLDLFADWELVIGAQTARTGSPIFIVYLVESADGTNYADVNQDCCPILCTFTADAATTARRLVVPDVPLPPGLFKVFLRNQSSQTTAATSNTLKYRPHSLLAT